MTACNQAEVLAGAIALGEATDVERQTYRGHVATCAACLRANGGEREIERTMACVGAARDAETWDPDLVAGVRARMNGRKRLWRTGLTVAGACVAASLLLNFAAVSGLVKIAPSFADPLVLKYNGTSITLEHRSTASLPQPTSVPRMIVEHNIVTLTRQAASASARVARVSSSSASVIPNQPPVAREATVKPSATIASAPVANVGSTPVWRRSNGSGGGGSTVSQALGVQAASLDHQAQSIVVAPAYTVRAPEPIGGETALTPQPAPIAFAQNASGTSVFEVQIDERGTPTKCAITKSSGFLSLDAAVCRAAMKAHYSPKLINGRPVPGSYTDAFTFRSNGNGEGV